MISAWHLFWIIPFSAYMGFLFAAFLVISKDEQIKAEAEFKAFRGSVPGPINPLPVPKHPNPKGTEKEYKDNEQ